jgi:hypothetical protein
MRVFVNERGCCHRDWFKRCTRLPSTDSKISLEGGGSVTDAPTNRREPISRRLGADFDAVGARGDHLNVRARLERSYHERHGTCRAD